MARGLAIDKIRGNVLKMDRHKCAHGGGGGGGGGEEGERGQ